jgi:hypothetical protein
LLIIKAWSLRRDAPEVAVSALLRLSIVAMLAGSTPDGGTPVPSDARGAQPFWLRVSATYVHELPSVASPVVGELHRGDSPLVTGCMPSCDAKAAWAVLGDAGFARLALLTAGEPALQARAAAGETTYDYGRVVGGRLEVRRTPAAGGRPGRYADAGDVLAVVANSQAAPTGWRETFDEGYVPSDRLRLMVPCPFGGEHDPVLPLAFFVRKTRLTATDGGVVVQKFGRLPALGLDGHGRVITREGTAPRSSVRLAFERPRPTGVGPGDRWVHVDLSEQVLTAYEGDRLVFATLVSTGKAGFPTEEGLYRVWRKVAHDPMHGEREPYHVEEVPYILYFHASDGLHGTFWHSAFGNPVSHGCVNLSMADAAWLFSWAPPPLPKGWSAILPRATRQPALWVQVQRAPLGRFPSSMAAAQERRDAQPTLVRVEGPRQSHFSQPVDDSLAHPERKGGAAPASSNP